MTSIYGDYSNLHDTRAEYLDSALTGDDALLLSMIHQASVDIDSISHRRFYPVVETRKFDTPVGMDLQLNDDILEIIEITNGDGVIIPVVNVLRVPYNAKTYRTIRLLPSVSTWKNNSSGFPYAAISVEGYWAHAADYTTGWMQVEGALDDISAVASTFEATPGEFHAGMLIKIDDEMMYISSVDSPVVEVPPAPIPDTTDTVHVERGVNGSLADSHFADAVIYKWNPGRDIVMLTAAAAVAYYHLKSNPAGNSYTLDGITFETPKDVTEFIRRRLVQLNLVRIGIG